MKNTSIISITIIVLVASYIVWDTAHPETSCASCHEISPSVESSLTSAHREIPCGDCHGTALSNGLHSLSEKTRMLLAHFTQARHDQPPRLDEKQIVEIMERCQSCHRTQYADWRSGGHSVNYAQIFLDEKHNKMEAPYPDCLRCHGMFYGGTVSDLVEPLDNKGPWRMINAAQGNVPAIPCLACHRLHIKNEPRPVAAKLDDPGNIFYQREARNIPYGLYVRADQMYLRADHLPAPDMVHQGKETGTPADDTYRLCVQCHAPGFNHRVGSEDDRTPAGVHAGLACTTCHRAHSNDARNSCADCHPAISNCGLDVTQMNTTYLKPDSPYNIHFVACGDCHPERK